MGIDRSPRAPDYILPQLFNPVYSSSLICVLLAKIDPSFDANGPDDDHSTAFGTKTLAERDKIREGFANAPSSRSEMPVEEIGGGRHLRVDQSANMRANSKVWNHGFEYRSLDHGLRDKYWRCKYCKPNKLFRLPALTNTSHAIRHLKKKHPVSFGRGREGSDGKEDDEDNKPPNAMPSTSAGRTFRTYCQYERHKSCRARRIQSSCSSNRRR